MKPSRIYLALMLAGLARALYLPPAPLADDRAIGRNRVQTTQYTRKAVRITDSLNQVRLNNLFQPVKQINFNGASQLHH